MLTLSGLLALVVGLGKWLWLGVLFIIPQVLDFLKPLFAGIFNGMVNIVSAVWEGIKKADYTIWMLVLASSALAGVLGYHYGWTQCIEWVHAHFRLITKVSPTAWWKFW